MDSKSKYNGVVVLTDPVYINDSKGNTIYIYGILYNMLWKMKDDLFSWECQRYLAYLYGIQRSQYSKAVIEPDVWITENGAMIILDDSTKNYIYKVIRPDIPVYRLVEFEKHLELEDNEYEECFLTSPKPLERYGIVEKGWYKIDKNETKDCEPLTKFVNTFEKYSDFDVDSDDDRILNPTSHPAQMTIKVSESQQRFINSLLLNENYKNKNKGMVNNYNDSNKENPILSFEEFVNEKKGTPSNVQSYVGCLDDEDDLEEE